MEPFDPADPEFVADPYPVFDALRERAPVHYHPGLGMPVAVSHAACSQVLRSREMGRIFVAAEPARDFEAFNLLHHNSLLEREPPSHTRLRRTVARAFARGHVERLAPWVQQLARRLVADLASAIRADGHADLLEIVAAVMPVEVIGQLLGVPERDRPLLQPWSNAIVKMYEPHLPVAMRRAAETASAEFTTYLRAFADERRAGHTHDLVSDLVEVSESGGERLSEDELIGTAALLLMAGHEASVNLVGNGILALLDHRDQWNLLVARPDLAETCVEELIRYDSPLQLFERTAIEDVEIAGYPVRGGEKIAALLGAAARDPAVFTDPSVLDITRDPNPHLGFGAGIHYCLGAPLARMEAAAVLRACTEALPDLVPHGEPERRAEFVIRGLVRLPVTAERRRVAASRATGRGHRRPAPRT